MTDLEQLLVDHLRREADAVVPRHDLEAVEMGIRSASRARRAEHVRRRAAVVLAAAALAAVLVLAAVVGTSTRDRSPTVPDPVADTTAASTTAPAPRTTLGSTAAVLSGFSGSWVSGEGRTEQSMEIVTTADRTADVTIRQASTGACSGGASTRTGSGSLSQSNILVVGSLALSCDDGGTPATGDPAEERLRSLAFAQNPRLDQITDSLGVVWHRDGSEEAGAIQAAPGATWPQPDVYSRAAAQALSDLGDPSYTWQLEPELTSSERYGQALYRGEVELVDRFLREELGWEEYLQNPFSPDGGTWVTGNGETWIPGLAYLRCAPGEVNPLYPVASDSGFRGDRCAPTVDALHYEQVTFELAQLDRLGSSGIWVVRGWVADSFEQADPSTAEAAGRSRLQQVLDARVAGEGAEGQVAVRVGGEGGGQPGQHEVPLLYGTTSGSPYERYEIASVEGPWWPFGDTTFAARLFADGGATVVEQRFAWDGEGGRLSHRAIDTTEDGAPVPVSYLLANRVTLAAPAPWETYLGSDALTRDLLSEERVQVVPDPLPMGGGCVEGPAPADAEALAESLASDTRFVTTAPVALGVGSLSGVVVDVAAAEGAAPCQVLASSASAPGLDLEPGSRARVYVFDLPEGSPSTVLAIAVVAPAARFDEVVAEAAPIVESLELSG